MKKPGVLIVMSLSMFIIVIDTTIMNVSIAALVEDLENWPNGFKQATHLGLHVSVHSQIKNGTLDGVLSDAKWILLARRFDITLNNKSRVKTVKTFVFTQIYQKLAFAQENSVSGIICDRADIGKTHTAKIYTRENKNVAYIDCGFYKTVNRFVRAIAREFGLTYTGNYYAVRDDLVFYLKTIENPLVILDEFGDLPYSVHLEFKALWNATDRYCGWFAMGADGLEKKITRNVDNKVIGFAEIFSRMGNGFQRITPTAAADFKQFQAKQISDIAKANGCKNVQRLIVDTKLSLRRIHIGLAKLEAEKQN